MFCVTLSVFLFVLCCFGLFRAVALVMLSRVFLSCFNLFSVVRFGWFLLCHVVQGCVASLMIVFFRFRLCWAVVGVSKSVGCFLRVLDGSSRCTFSFSPFCSLPSTMHSVISSG